MAIGEKLWEGKAKSTTTIIKGVESDGVWIMATWVAQMMNEAIDSGFCGTKVRHYKASERVTTALNLLSAQERGLLPHVDLSRISDVLSTEVLKDFIDIKLKRPRSKRKEFQLKS